MKAAYEQAVSSGKYDLGDDLLCKYDAVRDLWEEDCFRRLLTGPLVELKSAGRPLRFLDLGCGGGDGVLFLHSLRDPAAGLDRPDPRLLADADVACYHGIDINPTLLEQARERFPDGGVHRFDLGDLAGGLPDAAGEADPYDIYYLSFGTCSHLDTAQTVRLLSEIATHAADGAWLIADWLGRYSYEWQDLWDADESHEQWIDYRISYIYPPEERKDKEIPSFPLRQVSRGEVEDMLAAAGRRSGARFEIAELADRSLLSGRHIDTGEYNGNPLPLRYGLNRLHAARYRTDLDTLRVDYRPRDGFPGHNELLGGLAATWNHLLDATAALCHGRSLPARPAGADPCADEFAAEMARIVADVDNFVGADVRAEIIEPQLARYLREIEWRCQRGRGNGHGLVGLLRIRT